MQKIEGVNWTGRDAVNLLWEHGRLPIMCILHGSEDLKQDHYVTIARSNAHGLQNDVDGAFEAELKEDNQRRYERELKE